MWGDSAFRNGVLAECDAGADQRRTGTLPDHLADGAVAARGLDHELRWPRQSDAAIVPAGTDGAVSVYVTDTTNVIIDIGGFFISSDFGVGLKFYPLTPCRVVDTRSNQFPEGLGQPHLFGGQPRDLPIPLSSCIPSDTRPIACSFNLTAIPYEGKPMDIWRFTRLEILRQSGVYPEQPERDQCRQCRHRHRNQRRGTVYPSADTDLAIDVNGDFLDPGNFKPAEPRACRCIPSRLAVFWIREAITASPSAECCRRSM